MATEGDEIHVTDRRLVVVEGNRTGRVQRFDEPGQATINVDEIRTDRDFNVLGQSSRAAITTCLHGDVSSELPEEPVVELAVRPSDTGINEAT
jgi:hypothetical protein